VRFLIIYQCEQTIHQGMLKVNTVRNDWLTPDCPSTKKHECRCKILVVDVGQRADQLFLRADKVHDGHTRRLGLDTH
jgi:hypothetical protein